MIIADANQHASAAIAFNNAPWRENALALLRCVAYFGQTANSPSIRWQNHKLRIARRRMLVVWRFAADAERLAGSLSAGEESLIVEFALDALSCAFRSPVSATRSLGTTHSVIRAHATPRSALSRCRCSSRRSRAAHTCSRLTASPTICLRYTLDRRPRRSHSPFFRQVNCMRNSALTRPLLQPPLERQLLISPIAYSYVVVRLDALIDARRLYRLSLSPANQRALFKTVVYGGQSTDTPDCRWDNHKQRKLGDRLMLLVTRYNDASTLPANTRSIGEASVLDECALEHLKPLFVASGAFETDSGDRTARQLDNLGARACAPDQLERVARQLLRALYIRASGNRKYCE